MQQLLKISVYDLLTSGLASSGSHLSLLPSSSAMSNQPSESTVLSTELSDEAGQRGRGHTRVQSSTKPRALSSKMAPRPRLWKIVTQFRSGRSILLVEKRTNSPPLHQIRYFTSTTPSEHASSSKFNNVVPRVSPIMLYSTSVDGGSGEKLTFEEYRKLRKSLKMRGRVAGLPMGFLGMGISSFINVHFNPNMFNMTPEEVQPIL